MACKTGKALKDNQILIIYFIGEEIRVQRRICILFFFFFWLCWVFTVARGLLSWGSPAWLGHSIWDLRSPTRDQTHIPCTGRKILPWTTREVPRICIISSVSFPITKHMFHPCEIIGFYLRLSYSKPLHMLFPMLGMLVPISAFSINCVT